MCPRLFEIGPFTVYSYGLMMGVGFIIASIVLTQDLKRKRLDPTLGNTVTLYAIVFGIIGSKLLFLIEEWSYFVRDPIGSAFSPSGLTWYGGFFLATFAIWLLARRRKIAFAKICDSAAPALAIGYGVARIGCHLAGDGDYGLPTDLPWGTDYSKGIFPPSVAFRDFPDIVAKYGVNGVVPDNIPVHPAPIYEFLLGVILFAILWKLRRRNYPDGKLFMFYLVGAGLSRFAVEFIRLNPRIMLGLSEAQVISMALIAVGIFGVAYLDRRGTAAPDQT
jgi:phosphatidylglycerol:prolipoprotein diacylglycerol transferase